MRWALKPEKNRAYYLEYAHVQSLIFLIATLARMRALGSAEFSVSQSPIDDFDGVYAKNLRKSFEKMSFGAAS